MDRDVLVKHAYGNVYDAFWDNGWLNWTRFLFKKGEVVYIKGQYINKNDTTKLQGIVRKMTMPVDHAA